MPANRTMLRYAHSEGHTPLCYEDTGRYLLTCGSDGEVRIWDGVEDDDPVSKHVGDTVNAICFKNNRYFVASDTNSVLAYTFPDGGPDGIITRFTARVTHMCVSEDGSTLLAGSSDFTIKYVQLADYSFKVLLGHEAPILSVALDPKQQYAASSSCDGTVRVWNLAKQTCVKSWAAVFPSSNDFSSSQVLCRILWQPPYGKMLVVPVEKCVKFYTRDSWEESFKLTDESITEPINVIEYSPCGQYLAAGCIDGVIVIWNVVFRKCIERQKHEKGLTVCSLKWNPNGKGQIAYCDAQGQLGAYENILETINEPTKLDSLPKDTNHALPALSEDDDDENENSFSISKIKAETVGLESFLSDDSQHGLENKAPEMGSKKIDDPEKELMAPGPKLSELQTSFQPGSTPVHYQHRFMVWNTVGIVRSYNTEEENSIDIEFHDTAIHHSIHLDNVLGHTMADLSTTAVLLACQSQLEIPSKLVCLHFSSWDNSKDWTVDMPEDEDIEAIAASENWAAVATNNRCLRLFSIGNVQKQVLTLPGPVVAMAGHCEHLIVCYHQGLGFPGDQCLGLMLVTLTSGRSKVDHHVLPLSAKSTLAWIGFTDEGTPCSVDSRGVVRLLSNSIGNGWLPIADTRKHVKGKSDHYFIVGLSESQQQIRCILCKGSRYPATVPHPTVTVLPFELPLCEMSCEKGQLEENFWRHSLLLETLTHLDDLGFETDTINLKRLKTQQSETLIKLFALACRNDREFRALEVSEMMDSYNPVQLAIKYASKLKRLQLAQKLGEVAYQKKTEEEEAQLIQHRHLHSETRLLRNETHTSTNGYDRERIASRNEETQSDVDGGYSDKGEEEEEDPIQNRASTSNTSGNSAQNVIITSQRQNPFKASPLHDGSRGIHALDTMTKSNLKSKSSSTSMQQKATSNGTVCNQPLVKNKRQSQLFKNKTREKVTKETTVSDKPTESPPSSTSMKSGYQLWLEENLDKLKENHPDLEDNKFALITIQAFKKLPSDEKKIWNEKALSGSAEATAHSTKRRRDDEDEPQTAGDSNKKMQKSEFSQSKTAKSKSLSVNSKLVGFSFQK